MNELLNFDFKKLYETLPNYATNTLTYKPYESSCSYDVINSLKDQIEVVSCRIDEEKYHTIGLSKEINNKLIDLENQNKELRKMVLSLTTLVLTKIGNDQLKNN